MVFFCCKFNKFLKLSSDLISFVFQGAVTIFNCVSVSQGNREIKITTCLWISGIMPEFEFSPTAWIPDILIQFCFKDKYLNTNKIINILLSFFFSLLWKKGFPYNIAWLCTNMVD